MRKPKDWTEVLYWAIWIAAWATVGHLIGRLT